MQRNPYLGAKRPNAPRPEREIRQLDETVADGAQDFAAERAHWGAALADARARFRDQAIPEQKTVASRLGGLVEQISAEVEAGRAITAELLGKDVYLPDLGFEFGSLSDQ